MTTDTELRIRGVKALLEGLAPVEVERFIALMLREPFDYTRWQQGLWREKGVEELSKEAMKWREANAERSPRES